MTEDHFRNGARYAIACAMVWGALLVGYVQESSMNMIWVVVMIAIALSIADDVNAVLEETVHTPQSDGPETIGPHVIEPTSETTRVHYNHEDLGRHHVWECKYCDWSGTHPSVTPVNIGLEDDCEGFEWQESETMAFEAEYCDE